MANTLFTNVQIYDGTSETSYPGEVQVQGNRIHAVEKTPTWLNGE